MAHPACNFIRHTLTIFLPLLFPARMPKRGDSCKRKVAGAGLDLHRNKFIFAQIVIPLFFHAVMNFHSFLDGHQLHQDAQHFPLRLTHHSPAVPLSSSSPSILIFHPPVLPYYAYGTVCNTRDIVRTVNTLAHVYLTAFPYPCSFHSPAPCFSCEHAARYVLYFPVSRSFSVIFGCSSLNLSFVYLKARRTIKPCRMHSLMHGDDGSWFSEMRFFLI